MLLAAKYHLRNPEKEAARALAAGDSRIIAVVGVFPFVPTSQKLKKREGLEVREFCGIGDTPQGLDFLLQAACYDFALRFNDKVLARRSFSLPTRARRREGPPPLV